MFRWSGVPCSGVPGSTTCRRYRRFDCIHVEFIVLCKAFDTVDHDKLEYYGVRGIAHEWFSSYLSNRSQFVSLGHIESGPEQVLSRVVRAQCWGLFDFGKSPSLCNCCAASVGSEQPHNQDLSRMYRRGYEFSNSSLFTRMHCV